VDERGRGEIGMGNRLGGAGQEREKEGLIVGASTWRWEKEERGVWRGGGRLSEVAAHAHGGDGLPNRGRRWGTGDAVRVPLTSGAR
jgi:hypothetical protein